MSRATSIYRSNHAYATPKEQGRSCGDNSDLLWGGGKHICKFHGASARRDRRRALCVAMDHDMLATEVVELASGEPYVTCSALVPEFCPTACWWCVELELCSASWLSPQTSPPFRPRNEPPRPPRSPRRPPSCRQETLQQVDIHYHLLYSSIGPEILAVPRLV